MPALLERRCEGPRPLSEADVLAMAGPARTPSDWSEARALEEQLERARRITGRDLDQNAALLDCDARRAGAVDLAR